MGEGFREEVQHKRSPEKVDGSADQGEKFINGKKKRSSWTYTWKLRRREKEPDCLEAGF